MDWLAQLLGHHFVALVGLLIFVVAWLLIGRRRPVDRALVIAVVVALTGLPMSQVIAPMVVLGVLPAIGAGSLLIVVAIYGGLTAAFLWAALFMGAPNAAKARRERS